jgi:O-antigen ligase
VNLAVLQVRAAILTMAASLVLVLVFRFGKRSIPLVGVTAVVLLVLVSRTQPDATTTMVDRLRPVLMVDTVEDTSVRERAQSIEEGLSMALAHWGSGIGPGASLVTHTQTSAHQLQIQQFMETGLLGLIGSAAFTVGLLILFLRTMIRGSRDPVNRLRFTLLVGPVSLVLYGMAANATFNVGYVNTWSILLTSMVALVPRMAGRLGRRRGLVGVRPIDLRKPPVASVA